jgi:hypothetical protein
MAQEPLGTDEDFPEEALSSNVKSVLFLVLKFHLPVHVEACNLQFSFNLTKGIGRTDGEVPERGWANINPAALPVVATFIYHIRPFPSINYTSTLVVTHQPKKRFCHCAGIDLAYQ